jgi:hypothetical protein
MGPGSTDFLDLELDFCASEAPIFLAFQNEGGAWTRVDPNGNQTFAFRAADKVGLAMVFQSGNRYSTEIVYAQNDELLPLSGGACTEVTGTKSLNGSVANVAVGSFAYVSMALSTVIMEPPPSTFTLTDLPNGPLDLLAHRGSLLATGEVPNRVIIRRSENRISGTTMPVLDFASSEAQNPATNSLTVNGLVTGETNFIDLFFETATTFGHPLFLSEPFTSANQTIYHVPGSMTQAGDLHLIDVYGFTTGGSAYRGETQFYSNASNRTASFGGSLNVPTFTTVAASPTARLRMQLNAQSDYPAFVVALYDQTGTTIRSVSVLGSAAYFESPLTWDLAIPDLSVVPGFPTASGLQSGTQTTMSAVGYNGDIATYFGAPAENSTLRYAARISSQVALRALRSGTGAQSRQLRPTPALAKRKMAGRAGASR